MKRTLVALAALPLLAVLAACGSDDEPSRFAAARDACSGTIERAWGQLTPTERGVIAGSGLNLESLQAKVVLGDGGEAVIVNSFGAGEAGSVLQYIAVKCVAAELDAPDTLDQKLGATRALDGRQSETWEGVEMSWSYDTEAGLVATFSADTKD